MNKVILMGRLTRDPDVKYANTGEKPMAIARYTLAVDRRFKRDEETTADFIRCVAFSKAGEFAEKYFKQGTKIVVEGRIQTGSYEDKDGKTVYTTDVIVENQEFAESKAVSEGNKPKNAETSQNEPPSDTLDNWNEVEDDAKLPFNFNY